MARRSPFTQKNQSARLIAGFDKHAGDLEGATVILLGKRRTIEELKAILQVHVDASNASSQLRAAYADSVAALRAAEKAAAAVAKQVRVLLDVQYGDKNTKAWSDYGMVPDRKRGPKTLEGKLAGAETGRRTRKLRGTMGKRQRQKIKGKRGG